MPLHEYWYWKQDNWEADTIFCRQFAEDYGDELVQEIVSAPEGKALAAVARYQRILEQCFDRRKKSGSLPRVPTTDDAEDSVADGEIAGKFQSAFSR